MKHPRRKKNLTCPYCGSATVLRPDSFVYKENARGKHLYVCSRYPECDAYVSVNEDTLEPLGTLANGELRHKRIEAHRAFDQIWRNRIMTRSNAYRWLREKYGMRADQAHIAQFSDYMCESLIRECQKTLKANRIAA